MKESVERKLESISERYEEVQRLLAEPDVIANLDKYRELNKEYTGLTEIVEEFRRYKKAQESCHEAEELLEGADDEMKDLAAEELEESKKTLAELEHKLQLLLLPKDPRDSNDCFLEIRAGTGGDEACLFAGDLFRMYSYYIERKRWHLEIISSSEGEMGGYKEIISKVSGDGAYGILKFESGGHRVQRVPVTESQGRVHTSACTVMVMPEVPPEQAPVINPADLRIDTYRSSGAGGQHINKTDSAVRITHLPTGLVVECQDERSQHRNKERAMSVLLARLTKLQDDKRKAEEDQARHDILSSGDRSDRIRTYNFPQGRVTDHRINLTLYRLDEVLNGDMHPLIGPVIEEYQADQLQRLSEEG